jgi:hypothetical protein
MRRIVFVSAALLAPVLLVAVLLVAVQGRSPSWQDALNQYLNYKNMAQRDPFTVEAVVEAAEPWNLTRDLSADAYGESVHFITRRYRVEPTDDSPIAPAGASSGSLKPLPFPPQDVWCVLLKSGKNLQLVFVALHQDLYNADFVIHETVNIQDQDKIGCNFR